MAAPQPYSQPLEARCCERACPRLRNSTRIAAIALTLLIGAPFAWLYTSYARALADARERVAASSVLDTRCGPIEYAAGGGNGPPVLVVHGAGGGFDQGLALGRGLIERGYRVIAMSRFGYLRTPLPSDATAAAQADAHACLLDALAIPAAAIIGASAGAPSALQFALRHRERTRALVLLVPATYVPRPGDAPSVRTPAGTQLLFDTALRSDFLFWAATRVARDTVFRSILATPPALLRNTSATEQKRVADILEQILPVSARRLGLLNDAAITTTLERYELERIAAPTLILSARDDLFGTYDAGQYTAEHVPRARFIGYATGGHLLVGRQQNVDAEIARFLPP